MKIDHWAYARKYQIKCVFDKYPSTVFLFRRVADYYFIFSSSGIDVNEIPSPKDYVRMEYLLNKELGTLQAYRNRKRLRNSTISS
ncbi:hypothetical protein NCCP2222_34510 [Sporosarcina sp. NCCP-2222]|uniref:hypothetical protein n=1 Tax=Sporosarcina TaxID=1569 RepID=UPI001EDEC64A|nr:MULTISPECIES: hypothetical protein [Sporosarcina]MCG3088796.1 hypothetical protein [Sporosarcina cyprini]GKV57504.1 hypothetical protein NCCP2222_34510 [Sporosarcina sp. NCCP-2222]